VGNVTTRGGQPLPRVAGVTNQGDVLPQLRATFNNKPPWWEPRWGQAQETLDAAQRLGVANVHTLTAALGAAGSPADVMRRVRNFVAHQAENTSVHLTPILQNYGLPVGTRPHVLATHLVFPGITVFEEWINALRGIAFAAGA
jgi:hypothetical protein